MFLNTLVDTLGVHREFFKQQVSTRGIVELFIGWFSESNSGETFDWRLCRKLADMRINLSFDVYSREEKPAKWKNELDSSE